MTTLEGILRLLPLLILLSVSTTGSANPADAEFEAANALFSGGQFAEAASAYEAIIEQGKLSPDLFYNLGATQFRAGDKGKAALAFERALVMNPTHAEARQNLAFLTKTNGRLIFEKSLTDRFSHYVQSRSLFLGLSAAIWTVILGITAMFFIRDRRAIRSVAIVAIVLGLSATAATATGLVLKISARHTLQERAIALSNDLILLSDASPTASEVIEIPPGSQLRIVAERGPWTYLEVSEGIRGWLKSDSIEVLWPYGAELAD